MTIRLVPSERRPEPARRRFTVLVEQVDARAFDIRVRELPRTWTVAFDRDEIESRVRHRLALDLAASQTPSI